MRVIAIDSFTDSTVKPPLFHQHGHEFEEPAGPKLDQWLRDGVVREDDRMRKTVEIAEASLISAAGAPKIAGVEPVAADNSPPTVTKTP